MRRLGFSMFGADHFRLLLASYPVYLIARFSGLPDKKKVLVLMILASVLYLPLTFLSYGSDIDSHLVVNSGQTLIAEHKYVPSRYPGYFVHEMATAILNHLGGATLANWGTLAMSLGTIYFFTSILKYYNVPYKYVLSLALITNPVYWASSTSTIDHVWALTLMFIGYRLFLDQKYGWSGVFLGLAIGTRLSAFIFLLALLVSQYATTRVDRKYLLLSGSMAVLIGSLLYIPTYLHYVATYLHSGFILKLNIGEWNQHDYLINFIYGNLLLIGQQTYIALLCIIYGVVKDAKRVLKFQPRGLALFCILVIIGYEALFLRFPLEVEYLLPLLPFLLILLGIWMQKQKWVLVLWLLLQSSFNVVSLGFVNVTSGLHNPIDFTEPLFDFSWPTIAGQATSLTIGPFLGWGYLVADIISRVNGTLNG